MNANEQIDKMNALQLADELDWMTPEKLVYWCNTVQTMLRQQQAEIDTLKKQSEYHRWNIEEDGDDLLICRNEHEKGENCEYVRYTST